MFECELVREGPPSMMDPKRVSGNVQKKAQFCFERVEGRPCKYGLGICRSSHFVRICVRDSDENLIAVPVVPGVEQRGFGYAVLFSPVGFPRLFNLIRVREEGYNGGVLDRDLVKFVFMRQGNFDSE